jgi:hypothetical protein
MSQTDLPVGQNLKNMYSGKTTPYANVGNMRELARSLAVLRLMQYFMVTVLVLYLLLGIRISMDNTPLHNSTNIHSELLYSNVCALFQSRYFAHGDLALSELGRGSL